MMKIVLNYIGLENDIFGFQTYRNIQLQLCIIKVYTKRTWAG